MKPKKIDKQAECKKVSRWNRRYPVGTPVIVHRDNGDLFTTRTRSEAQVTDSGMAVIWIDGIAGFYSLGRIEAVESFK